MLVSLFLMLLHTGIAQGEAIPPARLIVHFFDVGYGDATLLRLPEGGTLLVDGGGPDQASRIAAAPSASGGLRGGWLLTTVPLAGLLIGFGDELVQGMLPERVFDWRDVLMNEAGTFLGLVIMRLSLPDRQAGRTGLP